MRGGQPVKMEQNGSYEDFKAFTWEPLETCANCSEDAEYMHT